MAVDSVNTANSASRPVQQPSESRVATDAKKSPNRRLKRKKFRNNVRRTSPTRSADPAGSTERAAQAGRQYARTGDGQLLNEIA